MALTTDPVDTNLIQPVIGVADVSSQVTNHGNVADPAQGLNAVQLEFNGGYAILGSAADSLGLGANTYEFEFWARSLTAGVSVFVYATDNVSSSGSGTLNTAITSEWQNYRWTSLYPASSSTNATLVLVPSIPCTLELYRYSAYKKRIAPVVSGVLPHMDAISFAYDMRNYAPESTDVAAPVLYERAYGLNNGALGTGTRVAEGVKYHSFNHSTLPVTTGTSQAHPFVTFEFGFTQNAATFIVPMFTIGTYADSGYSQDLSFGVLLGSAYSNKLNMDCFFDNGTDQFITVQSPSALELNRAYVATFVMGGGQVKLYLDGALVATANGPVGNIRPCNLEPWVGAYRNYNYYYGAQDTTVSWISLHTRALSDSEVAENATAIKFKPPANITA